MIVLVIDNYDSFTFNLVQYLGELGADVRVVRNDAATIADVAAVHPHRIVISPGPGRPEDAGITMGVIRELGGRTPLLGVCLGHQAIGAVFGGADARQNVDHRSRWPRCVSGHQRTIRRVALPFPGRRRRRPAGRPRGIGKDAGGRYDHGIAPSSAADPRRAVPSGVNLDRRRTPHPAQFSGG
jgi:glutamine amidotransferase class I